MELTADKKEAYLTLYEVLVELSKLIAPFAPYIADEIYTGLTFGESVHLEQYPVADLSLINKKLEKEMQTLIDIVTMGRATRNQAQIKVRQTLQALYVPEKYKDLVERMEELIKEEINVKEVCLLPETNDLVVWQAKLNMKIAGPKFGKEMKAISEYLDNANIAQILSSLRGTSEDRGDEAIQKPAKYHEFKINDNTFKLTEEDIFISIQPKEGFTFENYGSDFVALDSRLTEGLILEGHARELVNKIQFTRKENNFDIMDRVKVTYCGNEKIKEVFTTFKDYISAETLCDGFDTVESPKDDMKSWDINGIETYLKVEKV